MNQAPKVRVVLNTIKLKASEPIGEQLKYLRKEFNFSMKALSRDMGVRENDMGSLERIVSLSPAMIKYIRALGAKKVIMLF